MTILLDARGLTKRYGDFTTLTRSITPAEFKLPAEGISLDEVERLAREAAALPR